MIERNEVIAAKTWKEFDRRCANAGLSTDGAVYQRASLLALFTWCVSDFKHRFEKPLNHSFHDVESEWTSAVRAAVSQLEEFQARSLVNKLEWTRRGGQMLEGADPRMGAVLLDTFGREEWTKQDFANLFDHRFLRLAENETGVHRFITHFSAVLANAVFGSETSIIDVFSTTGEVYATSGNERWRTNISGIGPFPFVQQPMSFGAELLMRLYLHGCDVSEYRRLDMGRKPPASFAFHVPMRHSVLRDGAGGGGGRSLASARTTMEALAELQDWLGSNFSALAVVAGGERSSSSKRSTWVRRELVSNKILAAVIDLPRSPRSGVSSSAWIMLPYEKVLNDHILMVDLSGLENSPSQQEFGGLAEFAARLVRLFIGQALSKRWATPRGEEADSRLRVLFERQFSKGYEDVEGLCKAVRREALEQNGYVLKASHYFEAPTRPAWLSGIDGTPLVSQLALQDGQGRTFYVIGNNGEGKSLLLNEIARGACSDGRLTVGVASSLSDRFPLNSSRASNSGPFVYEGLRNTTLGINERRFADEMCNKFLTIHLSDAHLECLVEILELIDFKASRYVLPMKSSRSFSGYEAMMEGAVELTNDADHNKHIVTQLNGTSRQIALIREGSRGGITPFLELSSGERQIVGLIVKILANARLGCLFLIDEPEISLHVRWQRVLPRVFSEIARRFSCDIVVATHSPLIVTSVTDARSTCFSARRQSLERIEPSDRRSVEAALFKGFATHTTNNRLVHERCAALVAEAITVFNKDRADVSLAKPFLDELSDMRRIVQAASHQLEPTSIKRSVGLIHAAQEAVNQLARQQKVEKQG